MKKGIAIGLCILMLIALTACGATSNQTNTRSSTRSVSSADSEADIGKAENEISEVTKAPKATATSAPTDTPTKKATKKPKKATEAPTATKKPKKKVTEAPTATKKPKKATKAPTQAPTEVPSLKSGSTGEAVTMLQEYLIDLGYMTGKPTGKYNNATVKAVKDFQINNGLKETGKCDKTVWEELLSPRPVRQETVYKSKRGKVYHCKYNCSGMKNPTSMTLSDALRKKLTPCSRCH